ncbi:putative protein phosphatase 2C 12 [Zea mays]|uniref:protein-serine/threonine phosphatase n=1 Tax=Zea mays TaxID=4577 RepID=A0A1D6LDE0_MAIZE|nr:putative protein phosphatase 2C 12 [Zea mays]
MRLRLGGLCLSRSIGDQDVGEFIIPVPYVKQIKLHCWEVVLHHFRTKLNCKLSLYCLMLEAILLFQATVSGMLLTAEMAFKCARGLPPEAAAEPIVKEAVEAKGLRDDTTCIVIDIISPEKPKRTIQSQRTPGKGLVLLKKILFKENNI